MTGDALRYRNHINLDSPSRRKKAQKIEAILGDRVTLADCDVLDLGAGSGILSAYLRPRVRSIVAADREPEIFIPDDIEVVGTPGTSLPFEDARFDVVVFNHVIEHIGPRRDQARMLAEIHRVLRPGGLVYLAVPNRFAVLEPHYRLPFLSWLPGPLANVWVRAAGKHDWYDCNPYTYGELIRAMEAAGFKTRDATADAFYELVRIEKTDSILGRVLARTPRTIVRAAVPLMPTFVVLGDASIPPEHRAQRGRRSDGDISEDSE